MILTACGPHLPMGSAQAMLAANVPTSTQKQPGPQPAEIQKLMDKQDSPTMKRLQRIKTGAEAGEYIGSLTDCDGDGIANESRIDFNGDGIADGCVEGREEIPEPPFQQAYTPTQAAFESAIPAVGWQVQYQCGEDLYEVTLSRPTEDRLVYSADGLQLTSEVVYNDTDPNLNQPLVIKDPVEGLRYRFEQPINGEFYEYAIANYGGNVGLYIYQTGAQIVAVPCETKSEAKTGETKTGETETGQ